MSEGSDEGFVVGDPVATATLVDATRSLVTTLRIADAPADALERATTLVREATELLTPHRVHGTPGQNARFTFDGTTRFEGMDPTGADCGQVFE